MIDQFRIGDGEITSVSQVKPVYFKYEDLGLSMTEGFFNEEIQKFQVFYESDEITPIRFKPKSARVQKTSEYYFLKVDVKIPRNSQ